MDIIEKIISNFKNNNSLYIGEKVTIAEHMIQSAMIAEKSKTKNNLVCSCLLHDYGHFILDDPVGLVEKNKDGEHEGIGYEYLKKFFKKEVVEPIKNHVLAKRYLARDKKYFNTLFLLIRFLDFINISFFFYFNYFYTYTPWRKFFHEF